ncbi:hydrogenase [Rubrivivax gelatinosus]|uniref:hydrogenase n=1 Tax=Rubrivivax gelatinosus TaxID=28068 RepID=UPI001905FC60|nr:hydrogenase [Rubrivivax gelatinosus]MBK1614572.1 hydrogenase [Rubrivivax gelatinosus]
MSTPSPADGAAPLVARLVERDGAQWVDAANVDAFLAAGGDRVLFFHGDPVRFPEGVDVAVVLPELQSAFPGRFAVGVTTRADEDRLAARFGAQRWPSLVFLRDGRYVATIAGMLDWTDFVERVAAALAMPAGRAPIAVAAADGPSSCH